LEATNNHPLNQHNKTNRLLKKNSPASLAPGLDLKLKAVNLALPNLNVIGRRFIYFVARSYLKCIILCINIT